MDRNIAPLLNVGHLHLKYISWVNLEISHKIYEFYRYAERQMSNGSNIHNLSLAT